MIDIMDQNMHEIKIYLETLTTKELIKMADAMDIDIPPDLERIFIIQEILEADAEIEFEENRLASLYSINPLDKFEIAPLPSQYNVNYLEALLRDPLWAFVYWEINSLDRKAYESSSEFLGYFLHVIPLASKSGDSVAESFMISVENTDNSWRIYLSPDIGSFQVKLCVNRKGLNEVIISSREIHVPVALDPSDKAVRNSQNFPLLSLSGMEEFEILRNIDKVARTHRFSMN
jgi:hypothetical protein